MPFLHDHRRRVPTQDVDCSIVVGMDAEAAGATVERRLAFTAFPVYGSAGRTGLRGMARIDNAESREALMFLALNIDKLPDPPQKDSERNKKEPMQ